MDQDKAPDTPPPVLPEIAFLDLTFIGRVYRTTAILVVILALLLWETRGLPACLGLLIGSTVSLAMLRSLEWGVRRFISPDQSPGQRSAGSLLGLSALKMLLVAAVLVGTFLAARRGWVGLLWVLVGFAVPHLVLGLKLVGQKVNEAMNPSPGQRRN